MLVSGDSHGRHEAGRAVASVDAPWPTENHGLLLGADGLRQGAAVALLRPTPSRARGLGDQLIRDLRYPVGIEQRPFLGIVELQFLYREFRADLMKQFIAEDEPLHIRAVQGVQSLMWISSRNHMALVPDGGLDDGLRGSAALTRDSTLTYTHFGGRVCASHCERLGVLQGVFAQK
ncbi:hypothetical protein MRB53_039943 [Persea americana]|nr:hypothetical protein MRB53_039943 [Persea americana]